MFRVNQIKAQIDTTSDDRENYKRLAKLAGGVAVLYVGAASEVEMKEKKDESTMLYATRAAVERHYPGGGVL